MHRFYLVFNVTTPTADPQSIMHSYSVEAWADAPDLNTAIQIAKRDVERREGWGAQASFSYCNGG